MPTEKASFYARDPSPFTSDTKAAGKKKYMDVERRYQNRRTAEDRREEIRFDLSKDERRQEIGRRDNDSDPKFW